jgi:hypothetical protein
MSVIINGTDGVQFNDASLQGAAASPFGLKNRIINGDMRIDQRNAGASSTATSTGSVYNTVDRWNYYASQGSKFTLQQNQNSVTPPAGFTNYLGITSSTAATISSGDIYVIQQFIEGYNVADLDFGKSTAKTVTLSFWVRSSLTGTFGLVLQNDSDNRTYPITYTILAANTWEQKTITIAGDTSGTWLTTNGNGLKIRWQLAMGSSYKGTSGAWTSSTVYGVTGATDILATNGATFYITGVQLEIGSTATPFERRLYGQELINCQRYYQQWGKSSNIAYRPYAVGSFTSTTLARMIIPTMATMRTAPSFTFNNATNSFIRLGSTSAAATSVTLDISSPEAIMYNVNIASGGTEGRGTTHFQNDTNSTSLELSAEL